MKQVSKAIVLLFFTAFVNGQTLQDVLRYSTNNLSGTARYTAMGGAFGALGGDFGALENNPAAGSVFDNTQFSITTSFNRTTNDASYFGSNYQNKHRDRDFDQVGFVLVLKNSKQNPKVDIDLPWSKLSFAFNYQKTANFNNSFIADGYNNRGVDQYFLNNAQGIALENLQLLDGENDSELYSYLGEDYGFNAQQAFLGFQSYLIDATEDTFSNTSYISSVNGGSAGFFHEYETSRDGGIKKYTFNFSGEYLNKYNIGISINRHKLEYRETSDFYESNYSDDSALNAFRFNNQLFAFGEGISFQLGGIAKLNKEIRVGISYESPTWFSIIEETTQFVVSDGDDQGNTTIEPNVITSYPEYSFKTPSKYTGSFAYVFGKKGLVSVEYTQVNYEKAKFNEPNDAYLVDQNTQITNNLNSAGILRLGGEYRFGNYSIRAGYIKQDASLKNFDNSATSKSIGAGINFGGSSLDLSVVSSEMMLQQQLFSSGLTDNINLNRDQLGIRLSYILKL